MEIKIGENGVGQISADISRKYLLSGLKLGGKLSEGKAELFLEDDHGKRSSFLTRTFYGKISGDTLSGDFRISNYALILLVILCAVAVESLVAAIIGGNIFGIIFAASVIAAEILYAFSIKKISQTHDEAVLRYLRSLAGDQIGNQNS